ncbi:hypothetical protein [Rhodococcus erythropolis]|nr:hypothetical protein [Rhodococcus erythropolis]
MTPPTPRINGRKRGHGLFGMTVETAVILACIASAIAVVWWAA